jgi:hypothetical protein
MPHTAGDPLLVYLEYQQWFLRNARRELRRTAHHEAGHAVAYRAPRIRFEWVAVQPLPPELEYLININGMGSFELGRVYGERMTVEIVEDCWHDFLIATLAGPAAQARFSRSSLFRPTFGDREKVDRLLAVSRAYDTQRLEEDYRTLARLFVDEHWRQIEAVAETLIERRYLTQWDVRRIMAKTGPSR